MQLEVIICLALLFAIITVSLVAIGSLKVNSEKNGEILLAEAKAQKCAIVANSLFSNGAKKVALSENCYAVGIGKIASSVNESEREAFSIAKGLGSAQLGNKTVLEVKINEHYK
ncbi:MAG: hypothetical protein QGI60_03005 [archaeon]|jgi:hypothetical protein|nr:hypothetical protein [archaeon]